MTNRDVAIIGSGFSGTILATLLAKAGASVVVLDAGTHPRFVIGESTIPHTSLLLSLLAARYDVPEIDHLAYPDRIAEHVCSTCGIKRSFGFAYHRTGERYDPREGLQFGTSSKDENHFFRQDIDAYLVNVAVHYGVELRLGTPVGEIELDSAGARLTTAHGEEIRARYLVDATGPRSPLAERLGLRDEPPRFRHRSRTLYTHMIDVEPFEPDGSPLALPWAQSTLHHVFDGGWIWVIPFNNRAGSTNPLVSVGLTVDPRRHPPGAAPADEFRHFLERLPSAAPQFADAKPVRPWVSVPRLQYSSSCSVGERFCLMSNASSFLDPLFSRGLINTVEIIAALTDPLLQALDDDDFSPRRFGLLEPLHRRVADYNDLLVHNAYLSWSSFDLWNAWLRVWALGTILTEFRLMRTLSEFTASGDAEDLRGEAERPAFSQYEDPDYAEFFARAVAEMERFEGGEVEATVAAERIFGLTEAYPFPVVITRDAMERAGWLSPDDVMSERNVEIARHGYRWAIANPTTRDLFGTADSFLRWRAHRPDPHLV